MARRGPLYDNASEIERLYYINKIPFKYWKTKPNDISFTSMSYTASEDNKVKVTSQTQTQYYDSLLNCIKDHNNLHPFAGSFLCFSSTPSEEGSLSAGFVLAKSLIQRNVTSNIAVVDLSMFYQVERDKSYDLVILHNVISESTRDRIQVARDYVKWATRSSLCILCTAGKNPLEMCYDVLRLPANMVFFADDHPVKKSLDF